MSNELDNEKYKAERKELDEWLYKEMDKLDAKYRPDGKACGLDHPRKIEIMKDERELRHEAIRRMRALDEKYWREYAIRDDDDNVIGWKPNTPTVVIEQHERMLEARAEFRKKV